MSLAIVTLWKNLRATDGQPERTVWPTLFAKWVDPGPFLGQDEHPGWSPAEFDPCQRGQVNVQRVSALCLDYDGTASLDAAQGTWGAFLGFLHTTRKHTPEIHRFRVVLPFRRPVSPFEYEGIWRRVNAHAGGLLDPAPKDPSRFWFTPGRPDSGHYETRSFAGELFDPDEWLRKPEPVAERPRERQAAPTTDVERRASAYIARMPEAVSGAGGHGATWSVALVLARGFDLSEQATLRILRDEYNPRCVPPWSDRELEHKARQAASADRVPRGFLLEDDREWAPKRYSLPEPPSDDDDYTPEPPEWLADETDAPSADTRQPGDDTAEIATEQLSASDKPSAIERYGFVSMLELMKDVADKLNEDKPTMGARTGHSDLDEAIGGFRRGNVTVFGAKRGFGKTSFGNLVVGLAIPNLNVALFAGEDAAAMYGKRFLAARAGINAMQLRDYQCKREDWPAITAALAMAPKNPFFVRVDGRPVEWIAQAIRDVAKEQRIDLVIVDYLQCIRTAERKQDRRNEVTHVTKTLGNAIKSVDAAGLLFSQLKRTEREIPEVEDLKESGDIEDMADHIMLGWKVEQRDQQAERWIKIGKNKDGIDASEVQPVRMRWDNKTASFEPIDTHAPAYGDDAFADY